MVVCLSVLCAANVCIYGVHLLIMKIRKIASRFVTRVSLARHHWFDNFIFIHINKTGGSSIEKALRLPLEHKTAREKIDEIGLERWKRRFTFTVVRNPWDKVVSHYLYRWQTNQTGLQNASIDFRTWARLAYRDHNPKYYDKPKMFMPQLAWLTDVEGHLLVDFVCRFENLASDFETVLHTIGRKATLPHLKASKRGHYRDYYDGETIEIVAQWFQRDIEYFHYEF